MFTVQSVSVCACSLGKKCSSGVFYLQQQRGNVTVGKVNNIGHTLFHLRFFPSTHFSLWFYHHILLDWDNYALHICSRMCKHDVWRVFVRGMNTTQSLWKSCVFPQVYVWLTTELDPMCTGGFCFQLHTPLPELGQEILSCISHPEVSGDSQWPRAASHPTSTCLLQPILSSAPVADVSALAAVALSFRPLPGSSPLPLYPGLEATQTSFMKAGSQITVFIGQCPS